MLLDVTDKQKKHVLYFLAAAAVVILYVTGPKISLQSLSLGVLVFIVTGGRYKWLYILYRTIPRDLMAGHRFLMLNLLLKKWEYRNMTIVKIFSEVVDQQPDKIAFQFENEKWTFKQVEEYSNQIAAYFKREGFKRGDAIALYMETRPEFVCLWLGLAKVGLVTALINNNLRKEVLVHSINAANCKGIIVGTELVEALKDVTGAPEVANLPVYQFRDAAQESISVQPGWKDLRGNLVGMLKGRMVEEIAKGNISDKIMYIYTSGTTGMPKAAVISNTRFMFMVIGVNKMLNISSNDIIYDPLPLYHTAGGMVGVGQMLLRGATVTLKKKFSASNFWPDCIKYNCTVAQYIGEMCRYLLAVPKKPEDTSHQVRLIVGNGLRPQIWEDFQRRFNVKQIGEFYGATEGNSNLVNIDSTPGAVGFVPRYAGAFYPVALIKCDEETGEPIRNAEGYCTRCQPGETGVLVGKINPKLAANSFSGYADAKASEKKILRDVFRSGDMFFNSGDILVIDMLGYFYFKDRTGDTYRWRGENVATSEVEAVISKIVGLKDCVVYGVEIPNLEGRAGMAAIVDPDQKLDMEGLCKGLLASLPAYARPLFIRVMSEMPMTGTFKLKKRDLQIENYNVDRIRDIVYYVDSSGRYQTVTKALYDDIINGKIRL